VLSEEFGLHPLAVEDAAAGAPAAQAGPLPHPPVPDRLRSAAGHRTGELATSELAAFITRRALITVRKDDGLDIGAVVERWDASPDLAKFGVGYLLYGLLDYIVDSHFEAVQSLDDCRRGAGGPAVRRRAAGPEVQRRSFELRKSLVLLRRIVIPMREVVERPDAP
jgi:magnesium transporter